MAYLTAKNVPLYFGSTIESNAGPTEGDTNNKSVFANQVQLSYTPNVAVQRVVGIDPSKDSFQLAGPPNAPLSFTSYVGFTDEFVPTGYTGDSNVGTAFKIGDDADGIKASGAYLTSYSLTVTPYAPVLMQCDFAIYQPLTLATEGGQIAAAPSALESSIDFNDFGHRAYSTFNGTVLDDVSIIESVSYQFSAQRLPSYNIGGFLMNTGAAGGGARLLSAEHSFAVAGDNIQKLVPISGANTSSALELKIKSSDATELLSISVDGRINAENVTVSAGDVARGSMTISEPLV